MKTREKGSDWKRRIYKMKIVWDLQDQLWQAMRNTRTKRELGVVIDVLNNSRKAIQ